MNFETKNTKDVMDHFNTNVESGLSSEEVLKRQEQYGLNKFDEEKKESLIKRILHHLTEVTTLILLVAAAISFYIALTLHPDDFAEPIVILSIVILNVVLSMRQENSAERALESLKNMNVQMAVVIRDGVKMPVSTASIVPGDIIILESGDMIPTDARIISSQNLAVEESALTGESLPVEKRGEAVVKENSPIGDRFNMVFSGCLVTNGRGIAVVTGTGMKTEIGKIASLLKNTKQVKTPLQKRLNVLGKRISWIALAAGLLVFIIGLLQKESILEMLIIGVSLAVAAVPETLPVIVTLTLAHGVQKMVRRHAIIRNMPSVETLGSASVICSDKTGTLTQNKMVIKKIWSVGNKPILAGENLNSDERWMIEMLALASNATLEEKDGEEQIIGDPTEASIIRLISDKGISKKDLEEKYPRVHEIPFDSKRKLMTTVHKTETGYVSITKGAFDRLPVNYTKELEKESQEVHDMFTSRALRVISLGYKVYDELPSDITSNELENDLNFFGLIGMMDPPRPESKSSVEEAKKAGIRTVMITGDHVSTASAIAKEVGILGEGEKAITGVELNNMTQEELEKSVYDYSVYARVSPEDKIRIVKAWQANGEVVAMTGDGVNDAPALKAADVGVSMGISGTDVAKSASDMILTDDNFATIVHAIEEGRRVYENIRKTIYFLLSCNISEIFIMLIAVGLGWGAPVVAVQLLFINVVADGIPGFTLSKEKADDDIMLKSPIDKNKSIFANGLSSKIAVQSIVFTIVTLLGFYLGAFVDLGGNITASHNVGQTMAFVILGWSSVIHIFNVRSDKSIFKIGFTSNKILFLCSIISVVLILLVAVVPGLMHIFELVALGLVHWIIIIVLSVLPLFTVELQKLITNRR